MNEESRKFLRAYFGDDLTGVYVCDGNSMNRPQPAATAKLDPSTGWYWCPARLSGLDDRGQRVAANAVSVHALMVDDIGRAPHSKVDPVEFKWIAGSPLTMLPTSAGNAQAGFRLEGVTPAEFAALRARVPWDVDGPSCVHWFRMPGGVNVKRGDFAVGPVTWGEGDLSWLPAEPYVRPRSASEGQKADIGQVEALLKLLPNDGIGEWCASYDAWVYIGMAIKGALGEEGRALWLKWCEAQPQGVDADAKWDSFDPQTIGYGALEILAKQHARVGLADAAFDDGADVFEAALSGVRTLGDMWAYIPNGTFIDLVTSKLWSDKAALNNVVQGVPGTNKAGKAVMIPASEVLQRTKPVHQMSWMPGQPQIVRNMIVRESGGGSIVPCQGNNIWNQYRPPIVQPGKADRAGFWVDHMRKLYPQEWQHILVWMAHRVQFPWVKINHALVLGGAQGIGKDYMLKPLRAGIGEDNWQSIDPPELLGSFNGWRQAVVLIINEIHNLGESLNPYRFFEQTKTLLAAPPDVLRVNEKYKGEYYVQNVVGVVMTTNHKLDGLHLDEEDRRHFIAWSDLQIDDIDRRGWELLWQRMDDHVWDCVAYLREMDLSKFNPKAPPDKTRVWHQISGASSNDSQDEEVTETLERMGWPDAFTRKDFMAHAHERLQAWIEKASKPFMNKLDGAGYERAINRNNKNGRHKINGSPVTIYVRTDTDPKTQKTMVEKLIKSKEK